MEITTVYNQQPAGFRSNLDVVGCFLECEDKLLLVQRAKNASEGGLWGVPGGKVERGEAHNEALIREIQEELSIQLDESEIEQVGTLYIEKHPTRFRFLLYRVRREVYPEFTLNPEHQNASWTTYDEALRFPLMSGAADVFFHYHNFIGHDV